MRTTIKLKIAKLAIELITKYGPGLMAEYRNNAQFGPNFIRDGLLEPTYPGREVLNTIQNQDWDDLNELIEAYVSMVAPNQLTPHA